MGQREFPITGTNKNSFARIQEDRLPRNFRREVLHDDIRTIKLFFDIDDVLFPSTEFSKLARRNALNAMIELGVEIPYAQLNSMLERVIKEKGSNYPNHFDVMLELLNVPKSERAKYIAAAVGAYHDTKAAIHPYPDVPLALLKLREKHALYVASDGIAVKQWDKLIRMKLAMFFDGVFVSEELGIGKSVEFYTKIAQILGAKPYTCVMIGDREDKDIIPAIEAGWRTIRVRREGAKYSEGPTKADAEITSLVEIEDVLKILMEIIDNTTKEVLKKETSKSAC